MTEAKLTTDIARDEVFKLKFASNLAAVVSEIEKVPRRYAIVFGIALDLPVDLSKDFSLVHTMQAGIAPMATLKTLAEALEREALRVRGVMRLATMQTPAT